MKTFLSLNAKSFINTASSGAAVWSEMVDIKDLKLALDKAEADASTRGMSGWEATVGTLKKAGIEFSYVYDTSSTIWQKLQDSYINGTGLEMLVLDGPQSTTGSQGLHATMAVLKFDEGEEIEGIKMNDVSMKPTRSATPPAWYTAP